MLRQFPSRFLICSFFFLRLVVTIVCKTSCRDSFLSQATTSTGEVSGYQTLCRRLSLKHEFWSDCGHFADQTQASRFNAAKGRSSTRRDLLPWQPDMDLCFARGLTFKKTPSDSSVPGMKVTKVAKSRRAPSPKAARNKADSFCTVLFVYTKERRLKGVEQLVQGHTASRRDHDSSFCQFLTTALSCCLLEPGLEAQPSAC